MIFSRGKKGDRQSPISYQESKRLIEAEDAAVRADLVGCSDVRPEILYYLAEDPSPEVRRRIAVNLRTPVQANLLLTQDSDEEVRCHLAAKVARLLPQWDEEDKELAQEAILRTLELLARDQTRRVRQILAEALRDLVDAPPSVVRRLARDSEAVVACPVLEFSPLLSDQDLLEIIAEGCPSANLSAISRRHALGATVADAVVETDDQPGIAALLANDSAQIREETLDRLVTRAEVVTAWQAPLVERPRLSPGTIHRLAAFVADHLLKKLQGRKDLDEDTARRVAEEVHRRLDGDPPGPETVAGKADSPPGPAAELDDEALLRALACGDRDLVRRGLVQSGELNARLVERILSSGSAKGITALAWKAGFGMRVATQLQLRMGGIPPAEALSARHGTGYPLTLDEMTWQLEFFETLVD